MSVEKKKRHNWTFDAFADFFMCTDCNEEVSLFLFEYHRNGEEDSNLVLDTIVNKECKNVR